MFDHLTACLSVRPSEIVCVSQSRSMNKSISQCKNANVSNCLDERLILILVAWLSFHMSNCLSLCTSQHARWTTLLYLWATPPYWEWQHAQREFAIIAPFRTCPTICMGLLASPCKYQKCPSGCWLVMLGISWVRSVAYCLEETTCFPLWVSEVWRGSSLYLYGKVLCIGVCEYAHWDLWVLADRRCKYGTSM